MRQSNRIGARGGKETPPLIIAGMANRIGARGGKETPPLAIQNIDNSGYGEKARGRSRRIPLTILSFHCSRAKEQDE